MDEYQIRVWWQILNTKKSFPDGFECPFLLSIDADRVTEYVFETPGLSEMRGASAQLNSLNDLEPILSELGIPNECLVYAAGGSAVIVLPESKVGFVKDAVELAYLEQTGAATATCVALQVSPVDVQERFGNLVRAAGQQLRAAKGQKSIVPFFEVLPFSRRCDACRKRPAVVFIAPFEGEAAEGRCRVCQAKWQLGRNRRSEWHAILEIGEPPKDLGVIGDVSKGFIGLVYADGNRMGEWIQEANTINEFRKRSTAVREAVSNALTRTLEIHCVHLPFEVILVGGDDMLLVTPATVALEVAASLCRCFTEEMGKYNKTMSAGVILADHHTPVYFLRRLAEQLLKETKRSYMGASVDFLVLKSQGTRSIIDAWESHTFDYPRENLILHHGPYGLAELDQLLRHVRQGKCVNYPCSQLYGLRDTLKQGRQVSALAFLYQQARSSDKIEAFLDDFANFWSARDRETPPWFLSRSLRGGRVEYRTVWADMADLWDWVE